MSYPIISTENQILSRSHVISLLDAKKVPWRGWKHTPGCRTLDEMCKYHRECQFYFRNGDSEEFIIDVHVVVVHVYYNHPQEGWQEIFEEKQVARDGTETSRADSFDGLGETRLRGEELPRGVTRCLEEELKFLDPTKYRLSELLEKHVMGPKDHDKWKWVKGVWYRYVHECIISREIYNPNGYVETEEDGRMIYFKWRPRRQRCLAL